MPHSRLSRRYLKLIAPGLVERMALAVLKDEAKPQ
jgi:hypothetical protein